MAFGEMITKHLYECPHCNFRGYIVSQYFVSRYETNEEMWIGCERCDKTMWLPIDQLKEIDIKRVGWFSNNYFGIKIGWDNWFYPLNLFIALPFVTFTIGIGSYRDDDEVLPSITDQPCECPNCQWAGTVLDCEGDVDGDGNLGCPECLAVVEVNVNDDL